MLRGETRFLLYCQTLLSLALVGCVASPPALDEAGTSGSAGPLNHDPEVEYVGRESCRLCHFGRSATYDHVGMGRSFYPLTAERVVEDFHVDNEIVHETSDLHYRMTEREGRFFQTQFLLDGRGREMAVSEHELSYVVGSNNHGRAYVTLREGKLFQAPVCWNPSTGGWIFCPGFEQKNEHYRREISYTCAFCHNGRMELVEGERNLYTAPPPHGIGCERCHGPGELHVRRWRNGAAAEPGGSADPTIVNPRSLPREERMQVCFQCHLGDTNATERVRRPDRPLHSFRPGQRITEVLVPFRYVEQTEQAYGLVSQADRMILSRCFTESGRRMECLTCHNPHVTVYGDALPETYYRARCLGCHEIDACSTPDDDRQATAPPDDCVGCHMLRREPVDRKHTLFTDHWIRKRIDDGRRRRESHALEPIFPESFAALSAGEQAFYRARANFLRAMEAPGSARGGMWLEAEGSFREAIEAGYDTAEAWFFLGKTYMYLGRMPEAREALVRAVGLDPEHRDAAFAHGQALAALGRFEEANRVFAEVLRRDADDPMALSEYGRTFFALNQFEEALAAYDRGVAAAADDPTLHLNRGMALAALGHLDQAAESAIVAARLDPDGIPTWEFYANVMRAAGRADESARALEYLERRRSGR